MGGQNLQKMNIINKPIYGIINSGIFGAQIIAGIVTGVQYTEDKPLYQISFGKNSWWTNTVTENKDELLSLLNIAPLERIIETHGLKIKYSQ